MCEETTHRHPTKNYLVQLFLNASASSSSHLCARKISYIKKYGRNLFDGNVKEFPSLNPKLNVVIKEIFNFIFKKKEPSYEEYLNMYADYEIFKRLFDDNVDEKKLKKLINALDNVLDKVFTLYYRKNKLRCLRWHLIRKIFDKGVLDK